MKHNSQKNLITKDKIEKKTKKKKEKKIGLLKGKIKEKKNKKRIVCCRSSYSDLAIPFSVLLTNYITHDSMPVG